MSESIKEIQPSEQQVEWPIVFSKQQRIRLILYGFDQYTIFCTAETDSTSARTSNAALRITDSEAQIDLAVDSLPCDVLITCKGETNGFITRKHVGLNDDPILTLTAADIQRGPESHITLVDAAGIALPNTGFVVGSSRGSNGILNLETDADGRIPLAGLPIDYGLQLWGPSGYSYKLSRQWVDQRIQLR